MNTVKAATVYAHAERARLPSTVVWLWLTCVTRDHVRLATLALSNVSFLPESVAMTGVTRTHRIV